MPFPILPWEAIAERYRGTIILGNGASIAVSPSFSYGSLLQYATQQQILPAAAQQLFDFFETSDFELILRIVWQALNVNRSLQIEDRRTREAYTSVRDCLIRTVREVHPDHDQVRHHLPGIYRFLQNFDTVLSLNYDLIVYWAMTHRLDLGDRHRFKDCFVMGAFANDWRRLRQPYGNEEAVTLVFYPHGSLVLARNRVEREFKAHSRGAVRLLQQILQLWESEACVPLFVSEGTKRQKVASIQSSYYLSTIYREVLKEPRQSLVIFGWGLGEHDIHLLHRMSGTGIGRAAVSVFQNDQNYCNRAFQIIRDTLGQEVAVEFFDSESPGCWIRPTPPLMA